VKLPGKNGRAVWAGVVEMSAPDAVEWYEHALAGKWSVPKVLVPGQKPPPHRDLGEALQEPTWPQLNLQPRPYSPLPCVPRTLPCPRVHHRLVAEPFPASAAWSDGERKGAADALEPVIGFSLSEHAHLWESVRLVLPNPVLRSAGTQLVPREGDEDLGVTLVVRRGVAIRDLRVTIWEERDEMVLPLVEFRPTQPRTLVRLSGIREATAMTVDSDYLGRILVTDAHPFIKAIGLRMNLTSMTRRVRAGRPGKSPVEFDVSVHGHSEQSLVGTPKPATPIDLLRRVRWAADERRHAESDQEIWFSGNVDEAQERLRKLVQPAEERVWVVDYFFGAADAGILLPAIGAQGAEIRVLTSREGLGFSRAAHEAAQDLGRVVEQLETRLRMQPIEVRAMTGTAEIHDRFLVVDDRVYLLGSSINNYGARGTMLVRLRSTTVVLGAIEAAWGRAVPLSDIARAPKPPPVSPSLRGRILAKFDRACAGVRRILE
jgi:hypothetical protein